MQLCWDVSQSGKERGLQKSADMLNCSTWRQEGAYEQRVANRMLDIALDGCYIYPLLLLSFSAVGTSPSACCFCLPRYCRPHLRFLALPGVPFFLLLLVLWPAGIHSFSSSTALRGSVVLASPFCCSTLASSSGARPYLCSSFRGTAIRRTLV